MTLSPLRSLGITEWMLLVGLSILWGGSYLFMKLAVLTVPLFTIVLGRVSIAALALLIVLTISGTGIPKGRRIWLAFFGMGIFNNVIPMSLIVFSQNSISVGLASILNSITPLFTILVAHMTTNDERLTFRKLVGISCGIMGVVLLMGPELVDNFGVGRTRRVGLSGCRPLLCLRKHVWKAFCSTGNETNADSIRAGCCLNGHIGSTRYCCRSTMGHFGSGVFARSFNSCIRSLLHGARLCDLFPNSCTIWSNSNSACDVHDPPERYSDGLARSRGTDFVSGFFRYVPDWSWPFQRQPTV